MAAQLDPTEQPVKLLDISIKQIKNRQSEKCRKNWAHMKGGEKMSKALDQLNNTIENLKYIQESQGLKNYIWHEIIKD